MRSLINNAFFLAPFLYASSSNALPTLSKIDWHGWLSRFLQRRADPPNGGYYDPNLYNGSLLTVVPITWPPGMGEPINMIISGNSDDDVLEDREENGGLKNFFLSLDFSSECLGQHLGSHQGANLGDGNGLKNETEVMRYNYEDPYLGACEETVKGGNHFRYWKQDGPERNSGAYFLACSYELPIDLGHDIVRDGYNLGRDYIVGNITGISPLPFGENRPTNQTVYNGTTTYAGYTYAVDVEYVSGMLGNTSEGVNHHYTVEENGRPAMDGLVAVLTVRIQDRPVEEDSSSAQTLIIPSLLVASLLISASTFSFL